ncbi:MAG: glycosyltransferase family 2 protein [Candidatus Brocadiaceae bacterium]
MKDNPPSISIFIPVYNEEDIICRNTEKLVKFLNTLQISYEIVMCSNGSTDRTVELGNSLEQTFPHKIHFFALDERGVGRALKFSIPQFKYPYIFSLDMDLSADMSFVTSALASLNDYDIIIGSKRVGTQSRNFTRKLGSGLYIFLARLLLGIRFTDYSLGAKVYKKSILEKYRGLIDDYGTDYVINIVYHAFKDGCRILELPVTCNDTRASKFNLFKEGIYRYKKVFSLFLKQNK